MTVNNSVVSYFWFILDIEFSLTYKYSGEYGKRDWRRKILSSISLSPWIDYSILRFNKFICSGVSEGIFLKHLVPVNSGGLGCFVFGLNVSNGFIFIFFPCSPNFSFLYHLSFSEGDAVEINDFKSDRLRPWVWLIYSKVLWVYLSGRTVLGLNSTIVLYSLSKTDVPMYTIWV